MGTVDFIDNRVVATSGTIRMRAIFDNQGGILKSGLFIRIRLPIGKPNKTLLIAVGGTSEATRDGPRSLSSMTKTWYVIAASPWGNKSSKA